MMSWLSKSHCIVFSFLMLQSTFLQSTFAQVIDLNPGISEFIESQEFNFQRNELTTSSQLNIKVRSFNIDSGISQDSNVLLINKVDLFKRVGGLYRSIDLPKVNDYIADRSLSSTVLSPSGNWLVIKRSGSRSNEIGERELHFFDIGNEIVTTVFTSDLLSFSGLLFNSDASVFIFRGKAGGLFSVERKEDRFEMETVVTRFPDGSAPNIRFLSPSGDRIFFTMWAPPNSNTIKWFIIDRLESGWSEPKELVLSAEFDLVPLDYANNGRTLLVTGKPGMAVIHDEGDGWSKPTQFITDAFNISENGKVIAGGISVQDDPNNTFVYGDVIVYLQNSSGVWEKKQVNPPNVYAWLSYLLPDDGSQILWMPFTFRPRQSSIPFAELYK